MLLDDQGLQERVARIETLLGEIEALKDPSARSKAAEIAQVLLELYGEGLARMMEVVAQGAEGERAFEAFAEDELVCTGCTRWMWRRGWFGPLKRCAPTCSPTAGTWSFWG
jgi:hypothetical protein